MLFRRALRRFSPEVVVHLAGVTAPLRSQSSDQVEAINVASVNTIVEAASECGIHRVVFSSSSAIYGDTRTFPLSEVQPPDPLTAYGESKLRAEQLLRSALPALETISLRIYNVFGASGTSSLVSRLQRSTATEPVPIRGPDNFVRDYVHVEDVAAAVFAAINVDLPQKDIVVNIGTGIPTSNRQLITRLSSRGPVHFLPVGGEPSYSCADAGLATRILGFTSKNRI